jgi:hypothetical protein
MEITHYKPINHKLLQGTFTLKIPKWGNLLINEISYFKNDITNQRWINFPSKKYEKDGKTKYFKYLYFEDQSISEAFQDKVMKALDLFFEKNPELLTIQSNKSFDDNEEVPF